MIFLNLTGIDETAREIITELVIGIEKIDVDFIKALYLTGSVSLQDFQRNKSDIDFIIICRELPTSVFQLQLNEIHKKIQKRIKKPDLSGCYLTFQSLQLSIVQNVEVLSFHEGKLRSNTFRMTPVTLLELKISARTVYGICASDLPLKFESKVLNNFLYGNINSYWKKWIKKHSSFTRRFLLLVFIPPLTEWVVLGVARQLYTLSTGKITSKTEAGYYCLNLLPKKYHHVINKAIEIRADSEVHLFRSGKPSYYISPSKKRAIESLDCANFIISLFNLKYEEKYSCLK